MSRFASFASIILLSSTLAAGCDDDETKPPVEPPPPPPSGLEFKKLDEAQRVAAVQGAMGAGAGIGFMAAFQASLEGGQDGTCPAVTDKGTAVEIDAGTGCTTAEGTKYKGKIEIVNAPFFIAEDKLDPAKPMEMRFHAFELDELKLDGSIFQSSPMPTSDYTYKLELTHTVAELGIRVKLDAACDAGGCTSGEGSEGELVGKGTFAIAIDTANDEEGELTGGRLELTGKDKLAMDLGDKDAQGCTAYTIDGAAAGQICDPDDEE